MSPKEAYIRLIAREEANKVCLERENAKHHDQVQEDRYKQVLQVNADLVEQVKQLEQKLSGHLSRSVDEAGTTHPDAPDA